MPQFLPLLVVLACYACAAPTYPADEPPPHIIFHLADDLGWHNVGWSGNQEARTPHLDELAMSGVRVERLYTFKYCSPTRSSIMSGRLPHHVTQNNHNNNILNPGGADLRMTLLPATLKKSGYATAMTGKWHVGARSAANLPINRGFDSHLGFLKGGEDHYSQHSRDVGGVSVDLWRDQAPAYGLNGTHSVYLYGGEAVRVIHAHAASSTAPLFMYIAWQAAHTPLEAPPGFHVPAKNDTKKGTRARMNGLVAALDEGVANVTKALKATGMWDNTLVVFQADNGGWLETSDEGGNNYPLRGGKSSDFEGGVRARSFMHGGFLETRYPNLTGTVNTGLMHSADWYATFVHLAGGVMPVDDRAVPACDSVNVWDSLSTANATRSARTSVVLAWCNEEAECGKTGIDSLGDAALIAHSGRYKIVNGTQRGFGFYQGALFPNASTPQDPGATGIGLDCSAGCLFDLFEDPNETTNLKDAQPAVFQELLGMLLAAAETQFQTNYTGSADTCVAVPQYVEEHHGFIGPPCHV